MKIAYLALAILACVLVLPMLQAAAGLLWFLAHAV